MNGGRAVVTDAVYEHTDLGHVHAQDAGDVARTAPASGEYALGFRDRGRDFFDLCGINFVQCFSNIFAGAIQQFFNI